MDVKIMQVAAALLRKQRDEAELKRMVEVAAEMGIANAALQHELETTQHHFADNNEYMKSLLATKDQYAAFQGNHIRALRSELEALKASSLAAAEEARLTFEKEEPRIRRNRQMTPGPGN